MRNRPLRWTSGMAIDTWDSNASDAAYGIFDGIPATGAKLRRVAKCNGVGPALFGAAPAVTALPPPWPVAVPFWATASRGLRMGRLVMESCWRYIRAGVSHLSASPAPGS